MVNILGDGERRPARLQGLVDALRMPDVHVHLYDKRDVFDRRKMGHVTALGATPDEALSKARAARAALSWAGGEDPRG
jgi:5-(carboxyamino)imidazole ribonucleotide synthase